MDRNETLDTAKKIINGDRQNQYGAPEDNFEIITNLWSMYLQKSLTKKDVINMMIMLKIARTKSGHGKDDNYVDICGYAALGNEIKETINNDYGMVLLDTKTGKISKMK